MATTDFFYEDSDEPRARAGSPRGPSAVEMETAALFTLGRRLGVATACLLVVSDVFPGGERRRIGDEELADAVEVMGRAARRGAGGPEAAPSLQVGSWVGAAPGSLG